MHDLLWVAVGGTVIQPLYWVLIVASAAALIPLAAAPRPLAFPPIGQTECGPGSPAASQRRCAAQRTKRNSGALFWQKQRSGVCQNTMLTGANIRSTLKSSL